MHEYRKYMAYKYQHIKKQEDKFRHSIKDRPEITLKDFEVALHPYNWMELRLNLQSVFLNGVFFILIKHRLNFMAGPLSD